MKITILGNTQILDAVFFGKAVFNIRERLEKMTITKMTLLASGGPNFAHIPVSLFLDGTADEIIFKLPCNYDTNLGCFTEDEKHGTRINILHNQFANIMGGNTSSGVVRCLAKSKANKDMFDEQTGEPVGITASASYVPNDSTRADMLASCDILYVFGATTIKGFPKLVWDRFHPQSPKFKHFIDVRKMQLDMSHQMGMIPKPDYNRVRGTSWLGGQPQP